MISIEKIESHPRMTQNELLHMCDKNGVVVTAYNPFAGGRLLEDSTLKKIGENHKKSSAQV